MVQQLYGLRSDVSSSSSSVSRANWRPFEIARPKRSPSTATYNSIWLASWNRNDGVLSPRPRPRTRSAAEVQCARAAVGVRVHQPAALGAAC